MKNLVKKITVALIVFIAASCSKKTTDSYEKEEQINTYQRNICKSSLTGEEIFRGLFFLEGNIPYNLPSLAQFAIDLESVQANKPNVEYHRKELANDLIANIIKIDSNFFTKFDEKIKSPDYFEVKKILVESGKILEQAGLASGKYGNVFKLSTKILTNPTIIEQIKQIDISTKAGQLQLDEIVKQNELNQNEIIECGLAAAVCVYYMIAAAHSIAAVSYTAVGIVNFIGYAAVLVKTKAWFWSVLQTDYESKATMNDIFVKEIADYF